MSNFGRLYLTPEKCCFFHQKEGSFSNLTTNVFPWLWFGRVYINDFKRVSGIRRGSSSLDIHKVGITALKERMCAFCPLQVAAGEIWFIHVPMIGTLIIWINMGKFYSYIPVPFMYGIFAYVWWFSLTNGGKHTSPMDTMRLKQKNYRTHVSFVLRISHAPNPEGLFHSKHGPRMA